MSRFPTLLLPPSSSAVSLVTAFVLINILCVGLSGCSKPPKKMLLTVKGTLKINGNPAENARITLAPEMDEVPALTAIVKPDGSFQLELFDDELQSFDPPGDPVGDYHVLVSMPREPGVMLSPDRLGGLYSNAKTSKKKVSLELGDNQLDPIQFEGVTISN